MRVLKKKVKKATLEWTEGRIRSFVTSTLRGGLRRWPPKYICLNEAKVGKLINEKSGRLAEHYRCASCKGLFPAKNVQVDHIAPVVDPTLGFISWDVFIERLYCPKENLQVLCLECHSTKTKQEKLIRNK